MSNPSTTSLDTSRLVSAPFDLINDDKVGALELASVRNLVPSDEHRLCVGDGALHLHMDFVSAEVQTQVVGLAEHFDVGRAE